MPKDNQVERRRGAAINAACEAFAKFGYQKASMQDIAKAAGVSKSVLFKYFGTKERLYREAFHMAADGIYAADSEARAGSFAKEDVFDAMRRTVDARMRLFSRSPWVYAFSYAAAFDADPFVHALVQAEYARRGVGTVREEAYAKIRGDISAQDAQKLILWVSQGFLEEMRNAGTTEPEMLKRGFSVWIDRMELLLTGKGV
ncbi:HTH-type transcriptional regulator BetI [bioreactor metagenome]|uniref:HTH-type transcriptional regulator BetI n=1 Tax=bioreactor metagenome TaxID=1076179 RepID=A0A645HDF3_9ZZZZ|nr:TetR/AcrR family transcriptional regulator [Christensenella sp.]